MMHDPGTFQASLSRLRIATRKRSLPSSSLLLLIREMQMHGMARDWRLPLFLRTQKPSRHLTALWLSGKTMSMSGTAGVLLSTC
jgi:hypothetical protein